MDKSILNDLNDSQRAAVEYCDGPSLVIAGAGSGKTRVLTYKIAYLIQLGVKPWQILALTFTNKAAAEMKQRIYSLVGDTGERYVYMGTFHSIFARLLRKEAQTVGYQPNFTIYDEADSRALIKSIVKDMALDDKVYKPASIHGQISKCKNRLILPEQYARDTELLQHDRQTQQGELYKIYLAYQQRLRKANAMDFDDLLVVTFLLFRDHDDIRRRYADHFKYVLVDEFQDTNSVQQQIMLQLTKEQRRVCAVGDDYQSIYAFRGARIDNILDFQKNYPEAMLFKLERNYRSTPQIVQAANSLMKHNQYQIDKNVYSENTDGDKVVFRELYSDREEAAVVCKTIAEIRSKDHCGYSDFAILYRTNSQSRSFEDELLEKGVPYRIYGGLSFYQRKETKDITAYFRVVANPDDEEAIKRIVNYPSRGIGNTTLLKISDVMQREGVSFWSVISQPGKYPLDVNRGTLAKLERFVRLIESFIQRLRTEDANTLGNAIIKESGIAADLQSGTDAESLARCENMEEMGNKLSEFVDNRMEEGRSENIYLNDFLQEVSLLTDSDSNDTDTDKVNLMTVHASKGLEFATVFVVGLEENVFPSSMAMGSLREIEEERRLLYVAITRAEKHCFLTCARNRWRYGKMEFGVPSRFIQDISAKFLAIKEDTSSAFGYKKPGKSQSWNNDYESDRPYEGSRFRSSDYPRLGNQWQNSRPVAGQFMADPVRKQTSPRKAEKAIDPFSTAFKNRLAANGGNLKRVSEAIANGGRTLGGNNGTAMSEERRNLRVGSVIEHQRFGIGTVVNLEGVGDNEKATVEFQHTGKKQLLLKFARFKLVK